MAGVVLLRMLLATEGDHAAAAAATDVFVGAATGGIDRVADLAVRLLGDRIKVPMRHSCDVMDRVS